MKQEIKAVWRKYGWVTVWSFLLALLFGADALAGNDGGAFWFRFGLFIFILLFALQAGSKEEN